MDPAALLDTWLAESALRPSTREAYRREVTSWLTWCTTTGTDPLHAGIIEIARWAEDTYLAPYLDGRPFTGPDALTYLAETSPEAAKSHDRRITALNQYYTAAAARHLIPAPPRLTELRSGLDRADGDPRRLEPRERAALLGCIGMWGPQQARHYRRDRLLCYLLLERMRPGEIVRLDARHLYEQDDGGYEVRAPDYAFEAIGKQFVLDPLTGAALKDYLPSRPRPADGIHQLILGQGGRPINSRYPNMLVRQICDLHPLLAQRQPPVTADTIAHTGLWDTGNGSDSH